MLSQQQQTCIESASGDQQAFVWDRRLLHQSIQIKNKREDTYESLEISPSLLQRGFNSARVNKELFKAGLRPSPRGSYHSSEVPNLHRTNPGISQIW